MRRPGAITLTLLLAALAAISCSDGLPPEFPVPQFTLKSPMTNSVADNKTIEGKPAIIYWFTSW